MNCRGRAKKLLGILFFILTAFIYAQETRNLEIIWQKAGDTTFLSYGFLTTTSGDVNGDNFDDLIVGAPDFGTGSEDRIYIYFGGQPMDTIYDVAITGEYTNLSLGWYGVDLLNNVFDYDHAVFGCPFWPYGFPRWGPGKVYVLFGGNPMDSIPDVWMIGRYDTSGLGNSISTAGDVSGISSDAILAEAPCEPGYIGYKAAYVWLNDPNLDTIPDAWIKGNKYFGSIGDAVASAGDVNGDGKDEIMVSNYVSVVTPNTVWVCKYTGPGIVECGMRKAESLKSNRIRRGPLSVVSKRVKNLRYHWQDNKSAR